MGGHYWTDSAGEWRPVVVRDEFDLVVSPFARSGHGPGPRTEHLVAEVPDGPLAPVQIALVQQAARAVAAALREGRSTLVRCHSGYNRSGLVAAQALIELGRSPDQAIGLIRRGRSPWALNNEVFVDYLTAGLDLARLLTGLDSPG
jgi:hypothetical protein